MAISTSTGAYNEASIMYRRAIQTDRRFGDAYYHRSLADLKLGKVADAVQALRRAVELLKPGTPDSNDATLKLAEIMIVGAQSQEHNESLVRDAQSMTDGLLKRNPNGWEGHKLSGDLDLLDTTAKVRRGLVPDAKQSLTNALVEYRKALAARPGDYIITLALARTLLIDGQAQEARSPFEDAHPKRQKEPGGI